MGTTGVLAVTGGSPGIIAAMHRRIDDLERRWTRFDPTSELSRLNAAPHGRPTVVSPETFLLVGRAVEAWELTAGRFDPTVLPAMLANGYDRTFDAIPGDRDARGESPRSAPGCAGIELDDRLNAVTLPPGVEIDPGGIGKGLAVDLVATEAIAAGASGALVDLGGDIRVIGDGPEDGHWIIDLDHPLDTDRTLLHLAVRDLAVATSSRLLRRWRIGGAPRHHLVDPSTGAPTSSGLLTATVLAPECWRAEALTKAIFVSGDLTAAAGASAIVVDDDGACHATPDLMALAA